ncbi:MAG: Gfo/Idh/MocA family oxidoreductase [Dehalococcoidia bacterium]|nr:Gfo/Idh/MocA family oxidoreductase [Dehalococcoidia bacterium]
MVATLSDARRQPVARPMRFLVVGCGSIGKRHLRNLLTLNATDIIAVDTRPDRRADVEYQYGVATYPTLEAALATGPTVAVIAAPTSLHLPIARAAAEAGCDLFIEKPLADTMVGVEALCRIARARNLTTLVGCNLRFHPGLATVKRLIDDGAVGRVVSARVQFGQYLPDWHPWEDYRLGYSARKELGGGVILDAIHEIDYARWLLGEVSAVACFAGTLTTLDISTEDTAAILLRFASGAIGEAHLDYVQRVYSRDCQIVGEEGTIRWDFRDGAVSLYTAATREWQTFPLPPDWDVNTMYVDEMRHFLACLRGEEEPIHDVVDAARTLAVALAAKTAAAEQRIVPVEWVA